MFKFVKHQPVKLEDTQYEETQLIPDCLFYASRCPIGECLNAMPDCPDQFLFKEWSTVSSTMLIPLDTCPCCAATQALGLPSAKTTTATKQQQYNSPTLQHVHPIA